MTYSNPRLHAEIANWPMGGATRGTAIFDIEAKAGKGERGVRVTVAAGGRVSAPKVLTFASRARIVDGDDGRTYIAELTCYGSVSIMRSDMKLQHDHIPPGDARLPDALALFD
jgi:hypothetical protein